MSDTILYFSVDATQSNRAGKYINDAKVGNCKPTLIDVDGTPRIVFFATKLIHKNCELRYDYGDKLSELPWRKKVSCMVTLFELQI